MTTPAAIREEPRLNPETPVQYLKGVGPRIAELLSRRAVYTAWDMLFYLPFKYVDRRLVRTVATLPEGKNHTFLATVVSHGIKALGRGRRRILELLVEGDGDYATLVFFHFNEAALTKRYPAGTRLLIHGDVKYFRGVKNLVHPEIEVWDEEEEETDLAARIVPFYPLTEGLHQGTVRRIFEKNLPALLEIVGDDPRSVREDGSSVKISLREAFESVHNPPPEADVASLNDRRTAHHQRIIYDEFFYLQLGLASKRKAASRKAAYPCGANASLFEKAVAGLPFSLTDAQKEAVGDIRRDFENGSPMNRLLQGDVGSGKTIVAFLTALYAIADGLQTALMAPTEILAEQHFKKILPFEEGLGIRAELLTSAVPEKRRRDILAGLADGSVHLAIGTHALLTPDVRFRRLGYAIIDEQHRFGVMQRSELKNKARFNDGGVMPHLLVMTATPIPRTLSMTVYGDLDVSLMRELPLGRRPVTTRVVWESGRAGVYAAVAKELERGAQAYFVYPLVEESEKLELRNATAMRDEIRRAFPGREVGLVHGRLDAAEKECVMGRFSAGSIPILVATTVVEVGVDVPNASVMVIEHAERFGLSQLHQLRGRVGRGGRKSFCYLIAGYARSEESRFRLKTIQATTDGFVIAEEDLKLRGPGEFLGTKQAGLPDFRLAELVRDGHLLNAAKRRAAEIIASDPGFSDPRNARLRDIMLARWGRRLDILLA